MDAAVAARLSAGIRGLGLALAPAQVEALGTLLDELADWNTRMNLTAIKDPAEAVDKHLLDSLALLPRLRGLAVADVGSGAGFPGLPLAIADPGPALRPDRIHREEGQIPAPHGGAPGPAQCGGGRAAGRVLQAAAALRHASSRAPSARSRSSCGWRGTWPGGAGGCLAMKGKVPEAEIQALPAGWKAVAVHPVAIPGLDAERCFVELGRV